MFKPPHSIRKQTVELEVASEALALALRHRLSDLNRRRLLPIIERVMEELDAPGRQIKIDRLEVDLGRLPLARFEEETAERLYRRLRSALEEALRLADEGRANVARSQTEGASRLELLEHYLVRGTLPFWAGRTAGSFPEDLVLELAGDDPDGLVALVRRLGRRTRVLERIVLRFGEPLLRRLLRLLDPEHAALILAYTLDLRFVHRVERVLPLSDGQFARLVWFLVLTYLVQDPGSQFNRKSFIKSLLEGMAENEGLNYAEIVMTLHRGLRQTMKGHSLKSSLPAVIRELVRELDLQSATREAESVRGNRPARVTDETNDDALRLLEQYLTAWETTPEGGPAREKIRNLRGLLRRLPARDASRVARLIRRSVRRPVPGRAVIIDRLLRALPPVELLATLAPEWRRELARLAEVLGGVLARDAALSADARADACWGAVFDSIQCGPSRGVTLASMVRRVVEAAAARAGVSPSSLAESLARELGGTHESEGTRDSRGTAARPADSLALALEELRHGGREELRQVPPGRLHGRRYAWAVSASYELLEALRYYLQHGVLPWSALLRDPELTAEGALSALPDLPRHLLRVLLAREDSDEQLRTISRVVEALPEDGLAKLLIRLLPPTQARVSQAKGQDTTLLSSISSFAYEAADSRAFYTRLIAAILDGRTLDMEELAASGPAPARADELAPLESLDECDAHFLKSAIASRLRFGDAAGAGGRARPDAFSQAELLQALVTRHPEQARHFFDALGRSVGMRAAFVRHCPPSLFDRVLRLLCDGGVETLHALVRSYGQIPAPYRTRSEDDVRLAIFDETLRSPRGERLTESFFARVLRRLFESPLSGQVGKVLLRESGAWVSRDGVPSSHAAAFEAAVKAASKADGAAPAEELGSFGGRSGASARADEAARDAVFAFLLGESRAPKVQDVARGGSGPPRPEPLPRDALLHELDVLLEESPRAVCDFVSQHLGDRLRRESWVRLLPEATLVRLSYLLEPRKHRALLDAAEVLGLAWSAVAPHGHSSLTGRVEFWSFLLEFLASNAEPNRSTERLVAAFFRYHAARYLTVAPGAYDSISVGANMLEHAAQLARAAGRINLLTLLQNDEALLLAPWESSASASHLRAVGPIASPRRTPQEARSPRPPGGRARTAFGMDDDGEEEAEETIYIANAGLVILGPFLPKLFESLEMLSQDEKGATRLRDRETASRAVHLLQFLVDGRTDAPEPLLVLNKILCGLSTGTPVVSEVELTERERETCGLLLKSVIANWKIIENTSVEGLQETFLRREGRLERSDGGWRLTVQRKTVDVLVDQIPWGITVLYHRWMPQPLYVTW